MSCGKKCEVYSRIVGYFRPLHNWNAGKKEEFNQRVTYSQEIALSKEFSKADEVTCKNEL